MAIDKFFPEMDSVITSGRRAVLAAPHDTNELAEVPKAVFVGTGGNIAMRGPDDTVDTVWKNVANGQILPFRPRYIRSTLTTAADIILIL